jgi:pyrroline-5-carboxylate reductase
MKISFIGGGVMCEALIKSILNKKIADAKDIIVSDISKQRRDHLSVTYGVTVMDNNSNAVIAADMIILAVKPQEITTVTGELTNISPQQLVVSIAAGISLKRLREGLNHPCLIRAMPNMPAQIGEGITVWTATGEVSQQQKDMAKSMLSALGEEIYVSGEKYIDMATAISGSGPAYIFLIIEALTDAGVHIGLTRSVAEKLVLETVIGSARSMKLLSRHPAELRNMVTSPAGTTTEGLLKLETGGLRSLLLQAVIAAYEKARNLDTK